MKIIIGREEGTEQPRLCIRAESGDGNVKTGFLGNPGSVNNKVSRKHCCMEVDSATRKILSLTDITENNFMYVNGKECKSKKDIVPTDIIELGPDRYALDIEAILRLCLGAPTVSISGLKNIYDKYQKDIMDIQVRQGKINAFSSLPMVFSMGSGIIAASVPEVRVIGIILALIFMIGFGVLRFKWADEIPKKKKALEDQFRKDYVCPACGQFLGAMRPEEIAKKSSCPYCKAGWKKDISSQKQGLL